MGFSLRRPLIFRVKWKTQSNSLSSLISVLYIKSDEVLSLYLTDFAVIEASLEDVFALGRIKFYNQCLKSFHYSAMEAIAWGSILKWQAAITLPGNIIQSDLGKLTASATDVAFALRITAQSYRKSIMSSFPYPLTQEGSWPCTTTDMVLHEKERHLGCRTVVRESLSHLTLKLDCIRVQLWGPFPVRFGHGRAHWSCQETKPWEHTGCRRFITVQGRKRRKRNKI